MSSMHNLQKPNVQEIRQGQQLYIVRRPGHLTCKKADGQVLFDNAAYGENTAGPHALTSATTTPGVFPEIAQNIDYNSFDKVTYIYEGRLPAYKELTIQYGHHRERISQQYSDGQKNTIDKVWAGGCEFITEDSKPTTLTYLSGPEGVFALHVINHHTGDENIRYIHKDHASTSLSTGLGSWNIITDEQGDPLQELSFDACSVKLGFCECSETKALVEQIPTEARSREGNRRNPANWRTFTGTPPPPMFDRGFTGHSLSREERNGKHLYGFQLINMNGRMYDPMVSRMLSPDNFIQAPDFSQSFNRYSYCLNNPLIYTDPSGEFFLGTVLTFVGDLLKTAFIDGGLDPTSKSARQNAWKDFDPTAPWSPTNKAWKIDIGGFKTDSNRNFWGRSWQLISRWTWELPQTVLGKGASHLRNMAGKVDNVDYYGGATLVNDDDPSYGGRWGFTLGPYINSKNIVADPNVSEIFRHEYGHTLQSRLVGPLYLTHVALPSLIGSGLDDLGWSDHNREWYETQANRMAFRYFNNHDNGALTTLPWHDNEYPREYNPNWYWMFAHPPLPFMWWLFF